MASSTSSSSSSSSSSIASMKKKTSKAAKVEISPSTTSYFVVVTGSAGAIYQPCQVASPSLNLSTMNFLASPAATSPTQQHQPQPRQLTLPGTNVPLPLQPVSSFSPTNNVMSMSTDLLSTSLPSLDLLCSGMDDCDSTLDDIEQVLKDAENFDILA